MEELTLGYVALYGLLLKWLCWGYSSVESCGERGVQHALSCTWSDGRDDQEAIVEPCLAVWGWAGEELRVPANIQVFTCTSGISCWPISFSTITLTDHLSVFPSAESSLLFPDIQRSLAEQDLHGEVQLPGRIEDKGQAGPH